MMLSRSLLLVACCLFVSVVSASLLEQNAIHSASEPHVASFFSRPPPGWSIKSRASSATPITLVFAITQSNTDVLKSILYEVSNPKHPRFGQYLSLDEIYELTANPVATKTVEQWLRTQGFNNITRTPNGDFMNVYTTVKMAEKVLETQFFNMQHAIATDKRAVRATQYKLPRELVQHLDFVSANCLYPHAYVRPAHAFKPIRLAQGAPIPPGYVSPQLLWQYYGVNNPTVVNQGATQSVYENLDQSYAPKDLTAFQTQFNLTGEAITKVIGPNKPLSCYLNPDNCMEADLDVQWIMAVAQDSPTTFWSIANSDQSPFYDWSVAVGNDPNPPLVHSISYGDIESQDDPSVDQRFDQEIQKLGARGLSVIVASGDDGVANFIARTNASACGFNPSFPATSPHVTAVGATQGPEDKKAEIACTYQTGGQITTGGGFSTTFSMPDYQADAVKGFFSGSNNLPPSNMYNTGGRAYPDVAMMGHNYVVFVGGQGSAGSGTSASAPVFAAMITLINAQRIQQGKPALGFLNQILYQTASSTSAAFHDITSGTNNCCADMGSSTVCCQYGFTAIPGYDVVGGIGSIDFPTFSNVLNGI